jgi:hypothetical protein
VQAIQAQEGALSVKGDALLVRDQSKYEIGPHTDAAHRLITFLFYLPQDLRYRELGTSIYTPKQRDFESWDGVHYPHDRFDRVRTVEFLPNRLFCFPKLSTSFHGVDKIERSDVDRHLLIHNIRLTNKVTH